MALPLVPVATLEPLVRWLPRLGDLPRLPLTVLATPVGRLEQLGRAADIAPPWIKRDDHALGAELHLARGPMDAARRGLGLLARGWARGEPLALLPTGGTSVLGAPGSFPGGALPSPETLPPAWRRFYSVASVRFQVMSPLCSGISTVFSNVPFRQR